jgi:type II secretory pathway pseudopilin PulG
MKKSFSLLEVILTISILGFLYTMFIPKTSNSKIDEVSNRLVIYLKTLRYQAMIDNKFDKENDLWHKKRWTLKFFRCRQSVGGIYYSIYSDKNTSGHPSIEDSLKDPLDQKNIYSTNYCKENTTNSKYVLLTKNYNIDYVNVSCNTTTSLGQISFGSNGNVYSKLSNKQNDADNYKIKEKCEIKLTDKYGFTKQITIENNTGYVYVDKND